MIGPLPEKMVSRCYEAIKIRKSRRNFNGKALDKKDIALMEEVCETFQPFEGLRAVFVNGPPDDVFTGVAGSYGKVKGAPAYLAFASKIDLPDNDAKIGYLGEGIILEATAAGLSTCWVAGFFCPAMVKDQINLQEEEKIFAVTPLGYTDKGLNFEEKAMSFLVNSKKRKSLKEITSGSDYKKWPTAAQQGLEALQWAPSAVNRQPWKVRREGDDFVISTDALQGVSNISKRLDCGIAMLHFELALRHHGQEGQWHFLEDPDVAKWSVKPS
ncbi:nitroreductase [Heliorestis acidaminivorans]|uniref:Nitroreductase n=1 Tax=Heliorestis acidaminivorans TaxID=553427 RepID=A0A6I0EZP4_9FIRM|nr:nitroreductase family protein [Heliorestis acidaminivorans]KAB2952521.1 nitroreductase [Heliorestis acidaminivorans]